MSYESNMLLHRILDQPAKPTIPVIVYHQAKLGVDCPDGICAAWVVTKALQEQDCHDFELVGDTYLNDKDYQKPEYALPFDPANRQVIIVDFSYPQHIMQHIAAFASEVTVLDHHKSRGEYLLKMVLAEQIFGGFNIDECGATFAWNFLFSDKPQPWFLPYVRQRDIGAGGYYDGLIPESEAIGEAMSNRRRRYGIGAEALPFFDNLCGISESELIAEGIPKIEERNQAIAAFLDEWESSPTMIDVLGDLVPLFECPVHLHRNYSIVGSMGARRWSNCPFVAVIAGDPSKISLRSHSTGADVSVIARAMGGGGHKHAAGYSL